MERDYVSDSEPEREAARLSRLDKGKGRAVERESASPEIELVSTSRFQRAASSSSSSSGSLRATHFSRFFNDASEQEPSSGQRTLSAAASRSSSVSPPPSAQTRPSTSRSESEESAEESHESLLKKRLATFAYTKPSERPINLFKGSARSASASAASTSSKATPQPPRASSADKPAKKTKSKAREVDPALTALLPPELIRPLMKCPVCRTPWTAKVSAPTKLEHIGPCAKKQAWDLETVRIAVEKRIRALHQKDEDEKARLEPERSLFHQVIHGTKQGVMLGGRRADRGAVGVDAGAIASTQGGSTHYNVSSTQVSKELDIAKQPRATLSRLEKAVKVLDAEPQAAFTKRAPGRLQPYASSKERLAQKAQEMFTETSAFSASSAPTVSVAAVSSSNLVHKSTEAGSGQLSLQNLAAGVPPVGTSASTIGKQYNTVIEIDSDSDEHGKVGSDEELDIPLTQVLRPSALAVTIERSLSDGSKRTTPQPSKPEGRASLWAMAGGEHSDLTDSTFDAIRPSDPLATHFSRLLTASLLPAPASTMSRTASASVMTAVPLGSNGPRARPDKPTARAFTSSSVQPSPTAKRTSKASAASAATSSAVVPSATTDYSDWMLRDLKAEASKFGYKAPGTKVACINLLNRITSALQSSVPAADEASSATVTKPKATTSSITASPKATPKARKPRVSAALMADAGEDLDEQTEDVAVDASFDVALKRLIQQDRELWLKMLRYQPISFETFDRLANDNNLKHTAIGLRRFLDSQSITFFMEAPHKDRSRGRPAKPKAAPKTAAAKATKKRSKA